MDSCQLKQNFSWRWSFQRFLWYICWLSLSKKYFSYIFLFFYVTCNLCCREKWVLVNLTRCCCWVVVFFFRLFCDIYFDRIQVLFPFIVWWIWAEISFQGFVSIFSYLLSISFSPSKSLSSYCFWPWWFAHSLPSNL